MEPLDCWKVFNGTIWPPYSKQLSRYFTNSTVFFLLPTLHAGAEIFCLGLPELFCLGLPRDPSDGLPHLLFVLHWRPGRSVYPAHCQVSYMSNDNIKHMTL